MSTEIATSEPLQRQCAWCNRFYDAQGNYIPTPFIAVNVTHGICPSCFKTQKQSIDAMRKGSQCGSR